MLRVLILTLLFTIPCQAKTYTGSSWDSDTAKYYNGSSWVTAAKYRYNGSTWVEIEATGGGDDCSGDLMFSWHMEAADVTSGTPAGCSDGDEVGTLADSASFETTQTIDGTYSLYSVATRGTYDFDVSSSDIINDEEGKLIFYVYIDTYESETIFLGDDAASLGDDYLTIAPQGSSTAIDFKAANKRGGTVFAVTANSNRVENEWIYIEYRWKEGVAGNDHYLKICDSDGTSNCVTVEEDDDLTASVPYTQMKIGEATTSTVYAGYEDNLKIYATSGY